MNKTIAECFVFVDFDLYFTETDNAHVGLFEGEAHLSESSSRVGAYTRGCNQRRGLNQRRGAQSSHVFIHSFHS